MTWHGFFAIIASTIVLHELGHVIACLLFRRRVFGIVVCLRGIGIRRECGTPVQDMCISLAGPAMNLLLAILFWSGAFAEGNLALALANLLPFKGSDGANALQAMKGRAV